MGFKVLFGVVVFLFDIEGGIFGVVVGLGLVKMWVCFRFVLVVLVKFLFEGIYVLVYFFVDLDLEIEVFGWFLVGYVFDCYVKVFGVSVWFVCLEGLKFVCIEVIVVGEVLI